MRVYVWRDIDISWMLEDGDKTVDEAIEELFESWRNDPHTFLDRLIYEVRG